MSFGPCPEHGCFKIFGGLGLIEYTRFFIRRCVVLCVQVGWLVGGESECQCCGCGWGKCELRWKTEEFVWKLSDSGFTGMRDVGASASCVGRQKGLCGSYRYVCLRMT